MNLLCFYIFFSHGYPDGHRSAFEYARAPFPTTEMVCQPPVSCLVDTLRYAVGLISPGITMILLDTCRSIHLSFIAHSVSDTETIQNPCLQHTLHRSNRRAREAKVGSGTLVNPDNRVSKAARQYESIDWIFQIDDS